MEEPSQPPVTLIFPPSIEARAPHNDLGKEARGVQACAPGRRVSTEASLAPPATMNAWIYKMILHFQEGILLKSLVWQVSPWWKEEQHRRGDICFLAVGEVPRQNHRHCTCDEINADDVFIEKGEGEAMR